MTVAPLVWRYCVIRECPRSYESQRAGHMDTGFVRAARPGGASKRDVRKARPDGASGAGQERGSEVPRWARALA